MRFTKDTTKAIRKWLKKNGFNTTCVFGSEFEYDPTTNKIEMPKVYDNEFDTDFIHCLRELGLKYDFDCITLSILHELGHHETEKYFSEDEWDMCALEKMALEMSEDISSQSEFLKYYWNVANEKSANVWLVNYVNLFSDKVQELENIFDNIL